MLIVAAQDHCEAMALVRGERLDLLSGQVRVIVSPHALRGWRHGTPVLAGHFSEWQTGRARQLAEVLLARLGSGALRLAAPADLDGVREASA